MDFLFITGVVLSSITGLRIGKVGPSEIILLVWSLYIIYNNANNLKINFA